MQKAHDPPGRSSGWHRVGQTSLKPERLFLNNLQKGRSGCGCGQCHLSSGGSCLCALTPPWPASSLPLGPSWGRDKLEMLRPPSAPERKVPPRGGGLCPGARSCRERTRAPDYRRAGECSWQRAAACAICAWAEARSCGACPRLATMGLLGEPLRTGLCGALKGRRRAASKPVQLPMGPPSNPKDPGASG